MLTRQTQMVTMNMNNTAEQQHVQYSIRQNIAAVLTRTAVLLQLEIVSMLN